MCTDICIILMSKFPNAVNFTNTRAISFNFLSAHQNFVLNGKKPLGEGGGKTQLFSVYVGYMAGHTSTDTKALLLHSFHQKGP